MHRPTWTVLPIGLILILSVREGMVVGWGESWQEGGEIMFLLGIKQGTVCHSS